ncbi:MAG TPA: YihY/virulence factor BrkB family protein [Bacillales bacterium]|nr:YihY/virulence factor BrkB family protein [Bacillales bacterium]
MAEHSVSVKRYIKVFFHRVTEDNVFDLAAQLAYYFLLSLFPFLIFAIALLSYLGLSSDDFLNMVHRMAPSQSFDLIKENLKSVLDVQRGGLLSFGILFTIWTASNAINAMMRALNQAYNVDENRHFLIARGIAILLTFAMILVIIVALAMSVFGEPLGKFVLSHLGMGREFSDVWRVVRWLISFVIIVFVFSCLYYFGPNKRVYFKDVLLGAVIAAVAWQAVSLGFSYYVSNFGHYKAVYGSLGGVIILLIWFYLTGLIIIIGGEINAVNWFFERKGR